MGYNIAKTLAADYYIMNIITKYDFNIVSSCTKVQCK